MLSTSGGDDALPSNAMPTYFEYSISEHKLEACRPLRMFNSQMVGVSSGQAFEANVLALEITNAGICSSCTILLRAGGVPPASRNHTEPEDALWDAKTQLANNHAFETVHVK